MATLTDRITSLATEVGSWLKKLRTSNIVFVIGDNVNDLTAKVYGDFQVPSGYVITGWTLLGRQSGSLVVDIGKAAFGLWPTVSSITASSRPTLSGAQKETSSALSGWTTSISALDVLTISVISATGIKQATLILTVRKT